MSGTDILHVPYKGSGEARTAVIGGQVQMMFDAVTTMTGHHRGRPGAGARRRRATSARPCCPTCRPSARPACPATRRRSGSASWRPAGTPKDVVDRLNAEITKIVAKPAIREAWAKQGAVPMTMTPAAFDTYLQGRHRQVGQGHPDSRHQGAVKTLRILSGGAAHGLVEALRPASRPRPAARIDGIFGAVGAMKRPAAGGRAGRPPDPEPRADRRAGARSATSRRRRSGTSARCRPPSRCAPAIRLPALDKAGDLRAALRAADEIHFPDPELATAGIHFAKVMRELGIWERVAGRLRPAPNGATAMRALAASTSRTPIGCTQATEILATPGIVLVGAPAAGLRARDDLHLRRHRPRRGAGRGSVADRPADARPPSRDARRRLGFG